MKTATENATKTCLKLDSRTKSQVIPKQCQSKTKLIVKKSVFQDMKLFSKQTVILKRLNLNVINKYDKHFHKEYSQQLKAQNSLNQCSKPKHNFVKANESPQLMRLCPTISLLKLSKNYSLNHHSCEVKLSFNFDEHESSLMSCSEYCRYLNLINVKEINRIPLQQLKCNFNIRNIGKTLSVKMNQPNNFLINGPQLVHNSLNNYQVFIH